MRVALCSLVLNELEWLDLLVKQHRDWPGLTAWVFVEAADRVYAAANPDRVSPEGLSVDGTSEFLRQLAASDPRVTYLPHGLCGDPRRPAEGKSEARQQYLNALETVKPDWLLVLDADEFYRREDQAVVNANLAAALKGPHRSFCLPYRHLWRPPSLVGQALCRYEVTGGFWAIPHCHAFRWEPGLRYSSFHMTPDDFRGVPLSRSMLTLPRDPVGPGYAPCVHTAFASALAGRRAKHRYYAVRGEADDPRRAWYVRSRLAYENWRPGDGLPRGAKVVTYDGPVPEALADL